VTPSDGATTRPQDDSDNDDTSAPETEVKCDRPEAEMVGNEELTDCRPVLETGRRDQCPTDEAYNGNRTAEVSILDLGEFMLTVHCRAGSHIISYHIIYHRFICSRKKTNSKYSAPCMSKMDKAPKEHLLSPRDKN